MTTLLATTILSRNSVRRAAFVYLPVALLFLEYQISWQFEHSPVRFFYGFVILSLITLFLLRYGQVRHLGLLLGFGTLTSIIAVSGVAKALASTLILAYGYCLVIRAEKSFSQILAILFVINAVLIVCQVMGVGSEFYHFQTYSENWHSYISFLKGEKGDIPVHQQRASGQCHQPPQHQLEIVEPPPQHRNGLNRDDRPGPDQSR